MREKVEQARGTHELETSEEGTSKDIKAKKAKWHSHPRDHREWNMSEQ
jgi:hypothetical protein